MDVRFEEAVFQADQDIQEGQLIGGGGDGELDGEVKRVDVVEEHIQISPWARYRNPHPPSPTPAITPTPAPRGGGGGGIFGNNDFWIAQYVSFQYLLVCKMNYSAFRDYLRWYISA